MMKYFLFFFFIIFFFGCQVNTTNDTATILPEDNVTFPSNESLTIEDPYFFQQWYLDKDETFYNRYDIDPNASIHMGSYLTKYTGRTIKIAIIDDGLDVTHEDLEGAIVATFDENTHTTDVSPTTKEDIHGTAVTGIIAARANQKGIYGVAPNVEVIFLKYKATMSDSETIELFNKAEEFGADIINCSWGTYDVSPAVRDKIIDLATHGRNNKGILIVFACGNDNIDMGNDESSIDEVIAVGATNKDNDRAWYSNYGEHLDIMAPGGYNIAIATLDLMGSDGEASIDENYLLAYDPDGFIGTSASAPIVSASLALLLEKNPNLTREDVEAILQQSADKIGDVYYDSSGHNIYYGYGKLNVEKMLDLLE